MSGTKLSAGIPVHLSLRGESGTTSEGLRAKSQGTLWIGIFELRGLGSPKASGFDCSWFSSVRSKVWDFSLQEG